MGLYSELRLSPYADMGVGSVTDGPSLTKSDLRVVSQSEVTFAVLRRNRFVESNRSVLLLQAHLESLVAVIDKASLEFANGATDSSVFLA